MASWDGGPKLVQVGGESATLVNRLRGPLVQALSERRTWYAVRVEAVGRIGEVLVSITGSKGRLPLLFRHDELEPGHVSTVVRGAVDRFAL
jgi:hypothetical protein